MARVPGDDHLLELADGQNDKKDAAPVRDPIRSYLEARARLKELGIIRTERPLQSDYAEWLVANRLGLTLSENPVEPAFDATDAEGKTYQVKSRMVENLSRPTSFDFRDIEARFDYLVGVLFDPALEILEMVRIPYEVVRELGSQTTSTFRLRWNERSRKDERVERFRTGGVDSTAAELQRVLALVVGTRGNLERETRLAEESLALSREASNLRGVAISLFILGAAWRARGDLERATTTSEEAAAMLREQKHTSYLAMAINTLGWAALARGDHENARILFGESVGYYREVGDGLGPVESMEGLACVAEAREEAERAARLFGACEALREMMGYLPESGESALQEPYLAAARSKLEESSWQEIWEEGRAMTLEEAVSYALEEEEASG